MIILTGLLAGAITAAEPRESGRAKAEKQAPQLHGVWLCESEAVGGKLSAKPERKIRLVLLKDGEFVYVSAPLVVYGTYRVDESGSPSKIDLTITSSSVPAVKDKVMLGVYAIDGDQLKFCRGFKDRPADFTTKAGGDLVSQIYGREK
jgi:uncharacterized protein (TIGR03067 family)